jgi:hypothetical protein
VKIKQIAETVRTSTVYMVAEFAIGIGVVFVDWALWRCTFPYRRL